MTDWCLLFRLCTLQSYKCFAFSQQHISITCWMGQFCRFGFWTSIWWSAKGTKVINLWIYRQIAIYTQNENSDDCEITKNVWKFRKEINKWISRLWFDLFLFWNERKANAFRGRDMCGLIRSIESIYINILLLRSQQNTANQTKMSVIVDEIQNVYIICEQFAGHYYLGA